MRPLCPNIDDDNFEFTIQVETGIQVEQEWFPYETTTAIFSFHISNWAGMSLHKRVLA